MIDWFVQIALEMDVIFFLVLIFSEKGTPSRIVMWGLVFLALPLVGFIAYLFIGQTFYADHRFGLKGVRDDKLEGAFEKDKEVVETEPNEEYRTVMREVAQMGGYGYSRNNDFKLYTLGEDKFGDMYADIKAAKDHVHVEYYIIRDDELGNQLIDILIEKAKEGVEVRLMTDFLGIGKGIRKRTKDLEAAGGYFAVFHSVLWLMFSPKKNNRNHRKIAVIDGVIGYCGGFNIGDEYLGKGPLGFWRDTAVRLTGDSVKALQLRFQMDWEYATRRSIAEKQDFDKYYTNYDYPSTGNSPVLIVAGGPDVSDFNPVRMQYLALINKAQKTAYIHSPYFMPDESLTDALSAAAARGVDVRVIIPDKPDHMFVFWNNMRNAYIVMGNGVKVYNYNRGFIHSKCMVIDGEYCSIGSANMDDRSLVLNFETNAMIFDKELGRQMDEAFMEDISYSTECTKDIYENLTGYEMIRVAISRLFNNLT